MKEGNRTGKQLQVKDRTSIEVMTNRNPEWEQTQRVKYNNNYNNINASHSDSPWMGMVYYLISMIE